MVVTHNKRACTLSLHVQVRFPVLLTPQEKEIARMVCLAFGQKVCWIGWSPVGGVRQLSFTYGWEPDLKAVETSTPSSTSRAFGTAFCEPVYLLHNEAITAVQCCKKRSWKHKIEMETGNGPFWTWKLWKR